MIIVILDKCKFICKEYSGYLILFIKNVVKIEFMKLSNMKVKILKLIIYFF